MSGGTLQVMSRRCDQCIFSPARIVSAARKRQVLEECRRKDSHFICHKTKATVCAGFAETQPPSQMQRIAMRLRVVEMVEPPAMSVRHDPNGGMTDGDEPDETQGAR